ncbi:cytochrome P450 monooxygenase family 17 subfamily A (steroid 17alpha-monooxygenase) [Fusarium tjaetaba]|uniref:Cytochrome P450 monooxygenase family 17 subfamily A (Steroid 17alpha-monooxygenase) n=1 Tax=Fusarium tjaetaba TaxID=1567544 RepID=A0A8H5RL26_9HYPO|nr:cytochrome P450 monooxygenase family 17 subfamily A (steroid 17alpha-monooxygenase) [Fusarium tjaetaba]KAF5635018.1 cytochrome P450 monooxygenase family 17 subfamily A (steroid 17alpha-monooxygenase) [Fusarium tjaetaba]
MAVPSILLLVLGIVAGAALFYLSSPTRKYRKRPLKLPIISAIHSSPIERPLLRWDDWVKENGAIATSKLFGIVPVVVINTAEAATELLGKRGAWYSNRPRSVGMEMITGAGPGKSRFTLMHDMDAHLKLHHRILSPSLGGIAAPRYQPVMELEAKQLVKHLVQLSEQKSLVIASNDVFPFLERAQASIILALHYGVRVPTLDDPLYQRVRETQAKVTSYASKPGLPDIFPFLANLPAVISPWHKAADELFKEQKDLNLHLLSLGDDNPGWNATKQARSLAAKYAKEPISDIDLAFTLATSVQGGIETSTRTILWLFIAATTGNKRFMKRAHDLLDAVVGRDRLPRFSDRSSLSYIDAIISELLRWRPISPGGVPRRADKQDYFNGISIVKNAMVLTNAWSIGRDEAVFDQSLGGLDEFIPERWLDGDSMGTDIKNQGELRTSLPLPVFGHGRRSCLGKRVAVDGTFAQVVTMIWAFDFEPAEVVDEMEMEVVWFMTEPKPFKFKLKPRGPWVSKVIEEEWGTADKEVGSIMGNMSDIEN